MTSKFVRGKSKAKETEEAAPAIEQAAPEVKPAPPTASLERIKSVAAQFRNYINHEYHANVSYTPDANKVASISVSRWLPISDAINDALGMPGLPFGIITQAYGKKDSGKTTLLMEAIAACQREGILPILVLSEFKFDFNRLPKWMGADPEAMIVYPADDLESGFRFVEKILRGICTGKLTYPQPNPDYDPKKKTSPDNLPDIEKTVDIGDMPCFLFWDSIGGTLSQSEAEGEVEDWSKDMGRGAQAAKRLVKRSASLLNKVRDRAGVLFLNQAWTARTPTGISYDMPTCGEAVQHYYGLEIHMKRRKEIFMTINKQDVGIGFEIEFNIKKNHITHARPQTNLIAVAEGLLYPSELEEFKKRFRKVERLAETA